MAGVDPYLASGLRAAVQAAVEMGAESEAVETSVRVPMLLRVTEQWHWSRDEVPDLVVTSRLGDIVACVGTIRSFAALASRPDVITIEASRSGGRPDCGRSVPFIGGDRVHQPSNGVGGELGEAAAVAIIDDGLDVLHKAFREGSSDRTRVIAYWDQDMGPAAAGGGSVAPARSPNDGLDPDDVPYGSTRTADEINRAIVEFDAFGSEPSWLRRSVCRHGTHVASVAAGRAAGTFAGGVAPGASLIVVRLEPQERLGYSLHLMDALKYVDAVALRAGMPVVINVSGGTGSGARDGTSNVERAVDRLVADGARQGLVFVKSAGNEAGERRHARFPIAPQMQEHLVFHDRGGGEAAILELWFNPADRLLFAIKSGSESSSRISYLSGAPNATSGRFLGSGEPYELFTLRFHHDNGQGYCFVAVRPSSPGGRTVGGSFAVEIINNGTTAAVVDAWTDFSTNRGLTFANHVSDEVTLTVPGTAHSSICVGAVHVAAPTFPYFHSSQGRTRDGREKPEVVAPGVDIQGASAGTVDSTESMAGTSQAAAHVSGAAALLLSAWEKFRRTLPPSHNVRSLSAAQVRAALCASTQNHTPVWQPRTGHGVIDAEQLVKTFL